MKTERTFVNVGWSLINGGLRCSSHDCPIALAILRLLDYHFYAVVNSTECYIRSRRTSKTLMTIGLPRSAVRFIRSYDLDKMVKPVRFAMNIPKRYLKKTPRKAARVISGTENENRN